MIVRNNMDVNVYGRRNDYAVLPRFLLLAVMVFSISMPAIAVADGTPESSPGETAPETQSLVPADDMAPSPDVPDEIVPEVEDEVEPTDDSNVAAPQPDATDEPDEIIPEVEDEVDPTDDRVQTAPPPAAPDVPGDVRPVGNDEAESTNGTVERAPPTDPIETPDESIPVVVETEEPTGESTEESVPTETPTPPATPEPTETPAPSPTPEPAIPFDPRMTCVNSPGSAAPVAGDTSWSYLDCTATWETTDVSAASLLPVNAPVGWEIVPLNDRAVQHPDQMMLNPKPLPLIDSNPGDDDFASSKFHLAMRVSCVDATSVTVPLQFQATSGEDALRETATVKHPFSATAATLPDITLTSAIFDDVNPPEGTSDSTGVITMDYSNASETCGWKITTFVGDFVAPDDELPASDLSLVEVIGPDGLTSSIENGEITVFAAPGVTMPASGTLTITISLPVPETVSSGVYSTIITADAGAP